MKYIPASVRIEIYKRALDEIQCSRVGGICNRLLKHSTEFGSIGDTTSGPEEFFMNFPEFYHMKTVLNKSFCEYWFKGENESKERIDFLKDCMFLADASIRASNRLAFDEIIIKFKEL